MSHPNPTHEGSYPEDKVSHYPKKKVTIMGRAHKISVKAKALQKRMEEVGGRFTKK